MYAVYYAHCNYFGTWMMPQAFSALTCIMMCDEKMHHQKNRQDNA